MKNFLSRDALRLGVAVVGVLLSTALPGCGCRNDARPLPVPPRTQTPTSPVARVQTPTSPLRVQTSTSPVRVQTPTAPPPPPVEEKVPVLDMDKLAKVKEGMTEPEVVGLLGRPGFLMSQTGSETAVYRWAESGGPTLLARFENGKLSRKNIVNGSAPLPDEKQKLSEDKYNALTTGMTLEEALTVLEVEPKSQNAGKDGTSIVRWADAQGSSFTARFENGKLSRKTGFHVSLTKREASKDESATNEVTPEPETPAESTAETPTEEVAAPTTSEQPQEEASSPAEDSAPKRSRVAVAGTSRKGDEKDEGSYHPRAKLPAFAHGLRQGSFEVRINNPSDYEVKAGLRLGDKGVDVNVPARGHRSVKVDRGVYSFYFVSEGDPHTLNGGGGGIDLTSMFATDMQIDVIDENYEVSVLGARP